MLLASTATAILTAGIAAYDYYQKKKDEQTHKENK